LIKGRRVGTLDGMTTMRTERADLLDVPPGLKGVVVAATGIGDVRGEEGFYHYRQYSAVDLAMTRTFEEVWQLLVDGDLPDAAASSRFRSEVAPYRHLPPTTAALLGDIAATGEPLTGLRTALSLAAAESGLRPVLDLDPSARRDDALRVAAVTPTILCGLHRLAAGLEPVAPRDDLGHAANLLWMLNASEPDPAHVRALERYLVATIDHGFNASTFTARVVASTGADVGAAVVAAIGALSGPLHGGAPSRALALLDQIGTPDRIDEVVVEAIERGERIMGFGHAVYRTDDPRSLMLRATATELATDDASRALVDFARRVEARVVELLAVHKPGRRLRANVEFYAGVVMTLCGIPPEMFTPTFTVSRVVGWTANVLEQARDPRIIRPSARYVGPPAPVPVPPA
jgi:citrate synthase